ncbi:MAG: nitroreductase family protein [Lepagella sp.]
MKNWIILLLCAALVILSVRLSVTAKAETENDMKDTPKGGNASIENIMTRSSVRTYTAELVDSADVITLLKAGMAAPTAMNRQPWVFVVITDAARRAAMAAELPYCKMAATAPLLIAVCGDKAKFIEDAPEYWVQDCSAATENILLAAHALGLGAVWTGVYPVQDRVEMVSKALGLPEGIIPLNIICIGHPDSDNPAKDKWDPAKVHYNMF